MYTFRICLLRDLRDILTSVMLCTNCVQFSKSNYGGEKRLKVRYVASEHDLLALLACTCGIV